MSGGSYDYLYFDAEEVRRGVACMAEDLRAERAAFGDGTRADASSRNAREDERVPAEAVEVLDDIQDTIKGNEELLRAIEWYKSGDVSPDAIRQELD